MGRRSSSIVVVRLLMALRAQPDLAAARFGATGSAGPFGLACPITGELRPAGLPLGMSGCILRGP